MNATETQGHVFGLFSKSALRLTLVVLFASLEFVTLAQAPTELEEGFRQPPNSARARTLWMWMNGNVTADGITRDLEAMHRVGLGGALIFNVGEYIPKGTVDYGSEQWLKLIAHATHEADRLGLEIAMHNCPGWSSSGGPWITPEMGMQQLVWTETKIEGPQKGMIPLPHPYTNLNYYRDVCVLAFPSLPGEEKPVGDSLPRVRAGRANANKKLVSDGDLDTGIEVSPQQPLVLEFAEPFEARSITVFRNAGGSSVSFNLEASDDGVNFKIVAKLTPPAPRAIETAPMSANFDAVRARFFRVTPSRSREVLEIQLHSAPRITGWEYKANHTHRAASQDGPPAEVAKEFTIDPPTILDLTSNLDEQGRLDWDAPEGSWTILRFGHTARGQQNIAAPDAGVGLECDKLSRAGVEFHFAHGIEPLLEKLGPLAGKSFTGLEIDSYEVGMQNWTATFPEEFQQRNGYDLRRYLPAMTGRYVGSAEVSERFLWDIRRTQAQMVADNYYGQMRELCKQHGLQLYVEPYGAGPGDYDELQIGGRADVPMGEFWAHFPWDDTPSVRLAASAAHVYGKNIVAAESFTSTEEQSRYLDYPYALKTTGDLAFSLGLNRMFFHRWAHQPHPTAVPGMTMGPWGFQFDRYVTWFDQSSAWLDYLGRCQFLLQQGKFVADVLYFTGEGSPQMSKLLTPKLPPGYNFDTANAEVLLSGARVENGRIVLPDGMSYRLLALPDDLKSMTPELLLRLKELVTDGATLVGPKPMFSPSLNRFPESDVEARRLADELWGEKNSTDGSSRSVGKGTVFSSQPLAEVLSKLKIKPDFGYTGRNPDAALVWLHRRVGEADAYFVANRQRRTEDVVCTFRVAGKRPEFWQPETGEFQSAAIYASKDGQTRVPLHLEAAESVFVVFRDPADARPIQWLSKDGVGIVSTDPFPTVTANVALVPTNYFTVATWIKPDSDMMFVPRESLNGQLQLWGKGWVLPLPENVGEDGLAVLGIAAGRNGVVVAESAGTQVSPVLVSSTPISGWTHLVLVYQNGRPALYLNGKLIREGLTSGNKVQPIIAPPPQKIINYFDGDMTPLEIFPVPFTAGKIAELAAKGLPDPEGPTPIELTRRADGEIEALVWRSGDYSLSDGRSLTASNIPPAITLRGPWPVAFQPERGAPPGITLPELTSLRHESVPGVKYFSGTATYTHSFELPPDSLSNGRRVYLDLGRVAVIADVRVNGRDLGTLWKPPFRLDITDAAHAGTNQLKVRVADLWPNRLIGDEHLPRENEYSPRNRAIERLPEWFVEGDTKPAGGRTTFATWRFYKQDDPLVESGLLGPVRLYGAVRRVFGE